MNRYSIVVIKTDGTLFQPARESFNLSFEQAMEYMDMGAHRHGPDNPRTYVLLKNGEEVLRHHFER